MKICTLSGHEVTNDVVILVIGENDCLIASKLSKNRIAFCRKEEDCYYIVNDYWYNLDELLRINELLSKIFAIKPLEPYK